MRGRRMDNTQIRHINRVISEREGRGMRRLGDSFHSGLLSDRVMLELPPECPRPGASEIWGKAVGWEDVQHFNKK